MIVCQVTDLIYQNLCLQLNKGIIVNIVKKKLFNYTVWGTERVVFCVP